MVKSGRVPAMPVSARSHGNSGCRPAVPCRRERQEDGMSRIISALFDNRDEAEAVVTHLRVHDHIEPDQIELHVLENAQPVEDHGFWASLGNLLMPDSDRHAYYEGIRRGGSVVTADVDESLADHVIAVFNRHGAVDLETRTASWREEGWESDPTAVSEADLPANTSFAVGAARMGGTGVPMVDPQNPKTGPGSGLTR
jgi:hypothetical protein